MLDDPSYVDRLRAIFEANDPADGIDRVDGFGTEVRVADLRQVPGEHGDELEVEYELEVPPRLRPEVSSRGSTRVEFGEEWRRLSGVEDPAGYAPTIAKHVWFAIGAPARPRPRCVTKLATDVRTEAGFVTNRAAWRGRGSP